jgi:hypothetical protein
MYAHIKKNVKYVYVKLIQHKNVHINISVQDAINLGMYYSNVKFNV